MIDARKLTVRYDVSESRDALHEISLAIREGERVALAGANGAGKTTLLLALAGALFPHEGDLAVDDIPVSKKTLSALREKVGLVFQNPDDQLFMPTVYDDIAFGLRNKGISEEEIMERIDAMLSWFNVPHLRNRMIHKLSGGEKRLAALAGVLVMKPSLLLLDEPATFLDPKSKRKLIDILNELPQTMLLATHDLNMAQSICGRAILLREGRIYKDGPSQNILCDAAALEACGL